MELIALAEKQVDDELRGRWFLAKSNPDVFKAQRVGANNLKLRQVVLLTEDDA